MSPFDYRVSFGSEERTIISPGAKYEHMTVIRCFLFQVVVLPFNLVTRNILQVRVAKSTDK